MTDSYRPTAASPPTAQTRENAADFDNERAQLRTEGSDLALLLRTAWQGRRTVLAATFVCAALMAVYAFLAPQWYRAEVSLLPVEHKSGQELLSQLGGLSGLANLAGIKPTTGNAEPVAVLRSRDFARRFIEQGNLLPILFADEWDTASNRWKTSPQKTPDIRDGVEYFEKTVRRVGEERETGLTILTVEWTDPAIAASWANAMAEQINAQVRARAIKDAESSIAYLQSELQATNQVFLQQSISRLLETQMQNLMVARGSEEYAFRVIDKAHDPKKRFKPQRTLLVLGAAILGAFLAAAVLVLFGQKQSPIRTSTLAND